MKLNLLPNYFKKVGLSIILFIIVFLIVVKLSDLNISETFIKSFIKVSTAVAGYLFIMSKERIEDEFIQSARLRAFAASFLFGVGLYIIHESHIFYFISSKDTFNSFQLILTEMGFYLFMFYMIKYGAIRNEKQSKRNKRKE